MTRSVGKISFHSAPFWRRMESTFQRPCFIPAFLFYNQSKQFTTPYHTSTYTNLKSHHPHTLPSHSTHSFFYLHIRTLSSPFRPTTHLPKEYGTRHDIGTQIHSLINFHHFNHFYLQIRAWILHSHLHVVFLGSLSANLAHRGFGLLRIALCPT